MGGTDGPRLGAEIVTLRILRGTVTARRPTARAPTESEAAQVRIVGRDILQDSGMGNNAKELGGRARPSLASRRRRG